MAFIKNEGSCKNKNRNKKNLKQPLPTSNTALWNESALFLECLFFFFFLFFLSFILFLAGLHICVRGPSCVECSIWDLFEKDQNGMFSDFRENVVMSEGKWNE